MSAVRQAQGGGHVRVVLVRDEAAADATQEKTASICRRSGHAEAGKTARHAQAHHAAQAEIRRSSEAPRGGSRGPLSGVITACANNRAGVSPNRGFLLAISRPRMNSCDGRAIAVFRAKWIPVRVKKTRQNKD